MNPAENPAERSHCSAKRKYLPSIGSDTKDKGDVVVPTRAGLLFLPSHILGLGLKFTLRIKKFTVYMMRETTGW